MTITQDVALLERLPIKQLKAKYVECFGETTNSGNRIWLVRRIAWRLQANAEGGLTERAQKRAAELANDADLRVSPPRGRDSVDHSVTVPFRPDPRLPTPGTVIVRQYRGRQIEVLVTVNGFECDGESFKTLSAVAKAVTGQHCNGFRFFNLGMETTR